MIFVATKNGRTQKIFPSPLSVMLLDSGSRMDKIRIRDVYPGSSIPDTQQRFLLYFIKLSKNLG
jgi:hypothetical protein